MVKADFLNYIQQLPDLIRRPGTVLGRLTAQKEWVFSFLLLMVLMFSQSYITYDKRVTQFQANSQWIEAMPEMNVSMMQNNSFSRFFFSIMGSFVFVFIILLVALLIYIFYGIAKCQGEYVHFFSITVNAALISSGIPAVLEIIFSVLHMEISGKIHLGLLFPFLSKSSLLYLSLSQIELFLGWFIFAIASGMAVFAGIAFRKSLRIAAYYFLFRSILIVSMLFLADKLKTIVL